jgi:alkane 1-monooxygenase
MSINAIAAAARNQQLNAQRLKAIGFTLFFLIPALMPISARLAALSGMPNLAAFFPLFCLFVLLPAADYLIGRDSQNPSAEQAQVLDGAIWYRVLTLLSLPVYLAILAWSARYFAHTSMSLAGKFGWLASQGVIGGIAAINVAHELIHKSSKIEPFFGGVMLAAVGYAGFKVEHLRGHHVHVSTPKDASSARFGENVYGFVLRGMPRNVRAAFALEAQRLNRINLPALHWRNELIWWYGLTLVLLALCTLWLGASGAVFFIAQAFGAALSLEIINYIEHYGLERQLDASGRYERTTHLHSWNSNYLLTNLLLFQLQRHSDHHENPRRRYQALIHYDASPQLPGGYAAMFLLALVPPLWFFVINPRVPGKPARATRAA